MLIGYYNRNFQQKRMTKHNKKHIFMLYNIKIGAFFLLES